MKFGKAAAQQSTTRSGAPFIDKDGFIKYEKVSSSMSNH